MKLDVSITSLATDGEHIVVQGSGWERTAPGGETAQPFTFRVRDTAGARNAFRIGRELVITVEPK